MGQSIEFEISTEYYVQEHDEINQFADYVLQKQKSVIFMINAL